MFHVDIAFSTKHTKTTWPLRRGWNLFPSRGRGFRCPITRQWTKYASRNTLQMRFYAVSSVPTRNRALLIAKKFGYISVLCWFLKKYCTKLNKHRRLLIIPSIVAKDPFFIALFGCYSETLTDKSYSCPNFEKNCSFWSFGVPKIGYNKTADLSYNEGYCVILALFRSLKFFEI